jgi:ribonuclease D
VRELWQTRDEIARDADLSPRRVLSDQAIVDAARAEATKPPPTTRPQLERISGFHARYARKYSDRWTAAVLRARQLDDAELPEVAGAAAAPGPPPAHRWAERDPVAAARLTAARETVGALATAHRLPWQAGLTAGPLAEAFAAATGALSRKLCFSRRPYAPMRCESSVRKEVLALAGHFLLLSAACAPCHLG